MAIEQAWREQAGFEQAAKQISDHREVVGHRREGRDCLQPRDKTAEIAHQTLRSSGIFGDSAFPHKIRDHHACRGIGMVHGWRNTGVDCRLHADIGTMRVADLVPAQEFQPQEIGPARTSMR